MTDGGAPEHLKSPDGPFWMVWRAAIMERVLSTSIQAEVEKWALEAHRATLAN